MYAQEQQARRAPEYKPDLMARVQARAALDFRRASREGLLDFVPAISPKLQRPKHLAVLADAIEQTRYRPVKLTISVPPRHGKTETVLHGIAWLLLQNPAMQLVYASYAAGLSRTKSRSARDYAVTAGVDLRADANALQEWMTPQGGGLRSVGIGGGLTGFGADALFVDDPFKNRAEAESRIIRQRVWDWFTSTATTRLTPTGSIIVSHTRWHTDDLIGRLKQETEKYHRTGGEEGEFWEHINLPAITGDKPLAPRLWSLDALRKKRRAVGEYDWASLYQGDPRPRGAKLFREPVRAATEHRGRIFIGVDVAGTATTRAHWTVAIVMAFRGLGERMTADVLRVVRLQKEIPTVCAELEKLQKDFGGAPLIVESSGIGKAVPQVLRSTNPRLRIVEVFALVDKWQRAQTYAAAWNQGRVRFPNVGTTPEMVECIRVHTDFTGVGDAQDDDVDAGAHCWNHASGHTTVSPQPTLSLETSLSPMHASSDDED